MTLPFRPLGDRVVIMADREDQAPLARPSGLYTATSLESAVTGRDEADSWFVGRIVGIGPLVNHLDHRRLICARLETMQQLSRSLNQDTIPIDAVTRLAHQIQRLPDECPDPLRVGDHVTFSWASGQQMTIDGERYLIMHAKDVLAILDEVA